MKKAVSCAALSCAFGLAHAKALKWSEDGPRWAPPQETRAIHMLALTMDPPIPTPAPMPSKVRAVLQARDSTDNTCGYVSGIPTSSLWCAETAQCVYNSLNSHIGCCDDTTTNCPVWTTCYDSTDRESFTTDNGLTLWCGSSSFPHCYTHIYQDSNIIKGYSLLGCAVAAGTGQVWYSSTPTRSSTTSISDLTSTTSDEPTSTTTISSSATTTALPLLAESSTNIGAIVGGVVGGVAALGLIGLGVWLLMRMNNKQKKKDAATAAAAAAAGTQHHQQQPPPHPNNGGDPHMSQLPPHQQHHQQQPPYYGAAAANTTNPGYGKLHHSVAYSTTTAGGYDQSTIVGSSPPGSPPLSGPYQNIQGTPSPPPQQQQHQPQQQFGQFAGFGEQQGQQGYGQQGQQGYEQQQYGGGSPGAVSPGTQVGYGQPQGQGQQGGHGYVAELPAQRGDGELRELGG